MIPVGILDQRSASQYAVWSTVNKSSTITISGSNLTFTATGGVGTGIATIGKSSGKWYWEVTVNFAASTGFFIAGAINYIPDTATGLMTSRFQSVGYRPNGQSYCIGKNLTGSAPFTQGSCAPPGTTNLVPGDIISFALNMDSGLIKVYKNGIQKGGDITGLTGTWYPACGSDSASGSGTANFGQSSWSPITATLRTATLIPAGYNMGVYNI